MPRSRRRCAARPELIAPGFSRCVGLASPITPPVGGPETLIVVSSDLSHYHSYETARRLDLATAIAIERGDRAGLGPDQACGCLAVAGLLVEAGRRGLKAQRLALCNSGDTAGTRDQVVGYGASDGPLWCGHPRRACRH
jgi:AmmeMemoRadiSam system protein B